jgi:predicted transposase YbfD/YdcC
VKQNQGKLYEALQQPIQQEPPVDEVVVQEKKRGVLTTWRVEQFQVGPLTTALRAKWPSIQRVLRVHKRVVSQSALAAPAVESTSFRVTDVTWLTAKDFAEGIRGHWGIENRSHWVRDVILKEDDNGIKHSTAAVNMALFNTLVLNFLRQTIDDSIKYAQIIFGQNVKELFPLIRT